MEFVLEMGSHMHFWASSQLFSSSNQVTTKQLNMLVKVVYRKSMRARYG